MLILQTIVPIFLIVLLGWAVRARGFISPEFFGPANRLVYYLAIPAMIFRSISNASIGENFHGNALFLTLAALVISFGIAWITTRLWKMSPILAGTFVQCSGHGNLGYIGLAVAYYFLGDAGLVKTSLIAGFLMILQNLLSVISLQYHAFKAHAGPVDKGGKGPVASIFGNPVIISAMAGIMASIFQLPIPKIAQRVLDILSGMALPMALLLIGGSLSLEVVRKYFKPTMGVVFFKLVMLPLVAMFLFRSFGVSDDEYLPGLILLASPTATVTFVMSREMRGNPEFAVANISAGTLISAMTFGIWLMIAGG
jgi:predicted permease